MAPTERARPLDPTLALPRRVLLRGSVSGLAAAVMSRLLPGCDGTMPGLDAGMLRDAGRDAGSDAGAGLFPLRTLPARPALRSRIASLGPLGAPDANDLRLPAGFTSRVVGRSGQMVEGTSYRWHVSPDGGATYITEDGGWIYVSNSEVPLIGGVGAIRFSPSGEIVAAYPILEDTMINCAGGATPWHTWLSCEESPRGLVYECDPWGELPAVVRPALGVFKHEAAVVDPTLGHLYLSEDENDGCFYRFTPVGLNALGYLDLSAGLLEVAAVDAGGAVSWHEVPDPEWTGVPGTRLQVEAATHFDGGEGLWFHEGVVYFSSKGDNHVRAFDTSDMTMSVIYDGDSMTDPPLRGVDNLTGSCCGDVIVAEDGGTMQVVAILPDGTPQAIAQVMGQDSSEITGPAFDPSGTRLYFSSQRGGSSGLTFEVSGPFHEPL